MSPSARKVKFGRDGKKAPEGPWVIEVSYRSSRLDSSGRALKPALSEVLPGAKVEPRVSQLYLLEGPLKEAEARRIAVELLQDPVIQESEIELLPRLKEDRGKRCSVDVWLKDGVTDVVAQTVQAALKDLGFPGVRARAGTRYTFPGIKDPETLRGIAKKLLANLLIHDTTIPRKKR